MEMEGRDSVKCRKSKSKDIYGIIEIVLNDNKTKVRTVVVFSNKNVRPRENPDFLRNDKMVISVKIRNFFRSRMTKRTSPLESSREI